MRFCKRQRKKPPKQVSFDFDQGRLGLINPSWVAAGEEIRCLEILLDK